MRPSGILNRPVLILLLLLFTVSLLCAWGQDQRPVAKQLHVDTRYGQAYEKWLDEDARWLITDKERADFLNLATDKQRDDFIEAFWARRNPIPQSSDNPYKEEHYRRLAYSNTHFAAGTPGYRTDRGRFYIMYGPPDSVDSKPGFAPPTEVWHYSLIDGLGRNVVLTFKDECVCGKYQLSGADSDSRPKTIFDPLRQ